VFIGGDDDVMKKFREAYDIDGSVEVGSTPTDDTEADMYRPAGGRYATGDRFDTRRKF
jgi:hypothetical protein